MDSPGFDFWKRNEKFHFPKVSRLALGSTQCPMSARVYFPELKRPAHHSPPSRSGINYEWSYTFTLHLRVKYRENFVLYFCNNTQIISWLPVEKRLEKWSCHAVSFRNTWSMIRMLSLEWVHEMSYHTNEEFAKRAALNFFSEFLLFSALYL